MTIAFCRRRKSFFVCEYGIVFRTIIMVWMHMHHQHHTFGRVSFSIWLLAKAMNRIRCYLTLQLYFGCLYAFHLSSQYSQPAWIFNVASLAHIHMVWLDRERCLGALNEKPLPITEEYNLTGWVLCRHCKWKMENGKLCPENLFALCYGKYFVVVVCESEGVMGHMEIVKHLARATY